MKLNVDSRVNRLLAVLRYSAGLYSVDLYDR